MWWWWWWFRWWWRIGDDPSGSGVGVSESAVSVGRREEVAAVFGEDEGKEAVAEGGPFGMPFREVAENVAAVDVVRGRLGPKFRVVADEMQDQGTSVAVLGRVRLGPVEDFLVVDNRGPRFDFETSNLQAPPLRLRLGGGDRRRAIVCPAEERLPGFVLPSVAALGVLDDAGLFVRVVQRDPHRHAIVFVRLEVRRDVRRVPVVPDGPRPRWLPDTIVLTEARAVPADEVTDELSDALRQRHAGDDVRALPAVDDLPHGVLSGDALAPMPLVRIDAAIEVPRKQRRERRSDLLALPLRQHVPDLDEPVALVLGTQRRHHRKKQKKP
mmetsp:Transcript_28868/g.93049  ORF Transcript_28868/g.93049 Transcript_28868/m.93049 type:complete len:326 (-) Transcript_28868:29-1006(-)